MVSNRWLSQELHDTVAQNVWFLTLELSSLARDMPEDGELKGKVRMLDRVARETYRRIRAMIRDEEAPRARRSLRRMLGEIAERMSACTGLDIGLDYRICGVLRLKREALRHLACVVEEALWNAWKHGRARQATIRVSLNRNERLVVTVADNGRGFDTSVGRRGGYGIAFMRQRIRSLEGRLCIRSRPGVGTAVVISLPPGSFK